MSGIEEPLNTGFVVLNIVGFILLVMGGAYWACTHVFFDFRSKLLVMGIAALLSLILVGFLFARTNLF